MSQRIPTLITLAATLILGSLLAGCGSSGSGSEVKTNPSQGSSSSGSFSYTGKPSSNPDVLKFQNELWVNIAAPNRCGSCHQNQAPTFARGDDIELAYATVIDNKLVNLSDTSSSLLVSRVVAGHNCWLPDSNACGDIITGWINRWAGPRDTSANDLVLKAPEDRDIAETRSFPSDTSSFATTVYPLLKDYCASCHAETSRTRQQPYIGSPDVGLAYQAAKSKIRLDNPSASRLVQRLRADGHNCWSTESGQPGDCAASANAMQAAITTFANGITPVAVDPALQVSKAVGLGDAFVLSSGGRFDGDIIAKYEFKTGKGTLAYDTSGIEPAVNLNLIGNVGWSSAWGIRFADGGRAQATVDASRKLYNLMLATGEYSIEAWVIPDNVDQGMNDSDPARIVSYSAGTDARNFTLGQYDYNYVAMNRSTLSNANGSPELATNANDQRLQASLQHVVVTFSPADGRRIYVNGEDTGAREPAGLAGASLREWDKSFTLVAGNEVSANRAWAGSLRFLALHKHALSPAAISANYEVGVGAKYLLLFNISELVALPGSYVVFEVQQLDDYGYQFAAPFFTNLEGRALTGDIPLRGLRLGINGSEAPVGQVFANLNTQLSASAMVDGRQLLSPLGTLLEVKDGPEADVFFLSFDQIGSHQYTRPVVAIPPPAEAADIAGQASLGLRDFGEINISLAQLTGVAHTTPAIAATYEKVKQQLPTLTNLDGFLAAQQMGITQLTVAYCNALVNSSSARASFFPGFDFSANAATAFDSDTKRNQIIEPLLQRLLAHEVSDGIHPATPLSGQAAPGQLRWELNTLISNMTNCGSNCSSDRTLTTVKASCAATFGSALMLLQ